MAFVRYQGKWVETLLGVVHPERACFHCAGCGQGYVPLDHQLGLGTDSLSGGLEEAICLLASHVPLEQVADQLNGWREVKAAAIYETKTTVKSDGTTDIRAVNVTQRFAVSRFARIQLWLTNIQEPTIALEPELWYNLDGRLGRDAFVGLCVML